MWQRIKSYLLAVRHLGKRREVVNIVKAFFSTGNKDILTASKMSESATKTKILFMGKDALWYKVLKQALESKGEVYQSTLDELNGEAARRRYALIVVDTMDLPENKIRKTIGRLKKQQLGSRVVLASASPTWEPVREALKAGASDYITKSYDPDCVARFLTPYLQNMAKSSHS